MIVDSKTNKPVIYLMDDNPIEQIWGTSANIMNRFGKLNFCIHDLEREFWCNCS